MKLTQLEDQKTIYYIKEFNDELGIPIQVAFDDLDAARAYINRFRTFGDAEIIECHLNPVFYTDINRDCYFIQFNRKNDMVTTYLVTDLQRAELAFSGQYFFEGDLICIYVMAVTQGEAVKTAHQIKDMLVKQNP
ncbi:hypothetical protein [Pedobacter nyackensis]|uniref:Uncharacterized protein n=1 Tax=Pedobacter nyackensis TaxID=475255 RepID=A0A1W2CYA6_9SPHI|nr:hypothetical protein [Pedobacter nyackensis]SMC90269.1 hypothetical protein SAMN04488101_10589 [Pedobacter nyackensis]